MRKGNEVRKISINMLRKHAYSNSENTNPFAFFIYSIKASYIHNFIPISYI